MKKTAAPHCPYCAATSQRAIAHQVFTVEIWHCSDPGCAATFEVIPGTGLIRVGLARWMCCRDRKLKSLG